MVWVWSVDQAEEDTRATDTIRGTSLALAGFVVDLGGGPAPRNCVIGGLLWVYQ